MRQRILGSILLTWGLLILAEGLRNDFRLTGVTDGARAGQVGAWLLGVAMVYFGGRVVIRAIRQKRG